MCDGFFVEEVGDLVERVDGARQLDSSDGAVPPGVVTVDVGEGDAAEVSPDVGGDKHDDWNDKVHRGVSGSEGG